MQITIGKRHRVYKGVPLVAHFYCGRGTPLGNPYRVETVGREAACDLYQEYFDEFRGARPGFQKRLDEIEQALMQYGRVALLCHCAPERCHCETIRKYLLDRNTLAV